MKDIPLLFSFFLGILSFLSPCIIPMITVYLSLITGMTIEELKGESIPEAKRSLVFNTLLFIFGFGLIFTLAGGAAGLFGSFFKDYLKALNLIGGVLVILLGLHLAGFFRLKFLDRLSFMNKISLGKRPVGYTGSFLVGIFFAVACSHCIGPMLYSLLIYAGTTGSVFQGMTSLASFSLGLAIPYLITAFAITQVLDYLARAKRFLKIASVVSGVLLVFFGGLIFLGKFPILAQFFGRLLPYRFPGM